MNYNLHRVLKSWGESTSFSPSGAGTQAEPGDATWVYHFFDEVTPVLWLDDGGEFQESASATQDENEASSYYTWTSAQLKDDVHDMLDNPDENFGLILRANDESIQGLDHAFGSSENPVEDFRPVLTVSYIDVSSLNEPGQKVVYHVYPNPVKDRLTLITNSSIGKRFYQVMDLAGRVVNEGILASKSQTINTSSLESGCYFIRFLNTDLAAIRWIKE